MGKDIEGSGSAAHTLMSHLWFHLVSWSEGVLRKGKDPKLSLNHTVPSQCQC